MRFTSKGHCLVLPNVAGDSGGIISRGDQDTSISYVGGWPGRRCHVHWPDPERWPLGREFSPAVQKTSERGGDPRLPAKNGANMTGELRLRGATLVVGIAVAVLALPVPARTATALTTPEAWLAAFFTAYNAKDLDALRTLFGPAAAIKGAPRTLDAYLDSLRRAFADRVDMSLAPRGSAEITTRASGADIRQRTTLTYLPTSTGRRYRVLEIYDWILDRDGEALHASVLNFQVEAEPGLPVGTLTVTTFRPARGDSPEIATTTFRANETVCFRISTVQITGLHFVYLTINGSGLQVRVHVRTEGTAGTYLLGPVDGGPAGPVDECIPLGLFTGLALPAGNYTAVVTIDSPTGPARGQATFVVTP